MQAILTHKEFVDFCKAKGININKVSRNYVYIELDSSQISNNVINIKSLSNCRRDICDKPIYPNIKANVCGSILTLKQCIIEDLKVHAIKLLMINLDLLLSPAKNLYEANIDSWRSEIK
jgi:hypothetical protein